MTHTPITSFKKFLRKQAPITLHTLPHKKGKTEVKEEVELTEGRIVRTLATHKDGVGLHVVHGGRDKVTGKPRLDVELHGANQKQKILTGMNKQQIEDPAHLKAHLNSVHGSKLNGFTWNEEVGQLDELFHAATPQNSSKTDDLHSHLSDYYNIDASDKEAVGIYQKFHNHINNALGKAAAPKEEKSKPDPVDAEQEKYSMDAQAAGKKIDQLLGMHKSPAKEFHVYAGLKGHPFDQMKKEQGYDYDPNSEEPIEAHLPKFAQASIDPNFAKANAGEKGHVLKLAISPGSKHGAYIGHVNGDGHDREFLVRPGRKLRLSPQPEMHGDTSIWHGQLTGEAKK